MGLGVLNVWIHDRIDPCKISNDTWFVTVAYCSGVAVEWCGTTYSGIQAKCGHVEIRLPPGCYIVFGRRFVFTPGAPFPISIKNTDRAMVMVECDEKACVHIYTPTDRQHMHRVSSALGSLAPDEGIPRDKVDRLSEALQGVLEHLPKTAGDTAFATLLEEQPKPPESGPKDATSPE